MNINCINNKIATANGVIQPIILQSIKDIYLNGNHQMTARMVKNQCVILDVNILWNERIPAICNAMKNATECGGKIVGEYREINGFTIAFDGNTTNLEIKPTRKTTSKDKENRNILEQKKSPENKIEDLNEKNSTFNKNKIFLIPCSSSKILKEELENIPFNLNKLEFNNELGKYRKELLDILKKSEFNNTHKRSVSKTKNKVSKPEIIIITNEFNFNRTAQANKLYSKGKLYHSNSSDSINWTQKDKEKIYIFSALFGIVRADNYIPLYDLAMIDEIDKQVKFPQKFWKGKLDSIIERLSNNGYLICNLLSGDYSKSLKNKTLSIITKPENKFTDRGEQKGKWLKNELKKH